MSSQPRGTRATSNQSEQIEWRRPADLRPHPEAALIPLLPEAERLALVKDIELRGVLEPLHLSATGFVLDGHERLRAAEALGLKRLPIRVVTPADERAYMLLAALRRKHLNPAQRAALALELPLIEQERERARQRQRANLRQTEVASLPPRGERTREQVAQLASVSPRTVQAVETVRQLDRDLFEQVKQGLLPAERAARRLRQARLAEGLGEAPPLPTGLFDLIYADPPWQLGNPDSDTAPENHYPTMGLEEIAALELPVAENAILFLWAVNCVLEQAFEVMRTWGFSPKTNLAWVKPSIGLGSWARNRHELLLVGVRGAFAPPPSARRPDSVIEAKRRRHSQKPDCVYELIEAMYPDAKRLELFARGTRQGWSAWGNEVPR
jgi:N6-adenosine-specific RNA methylase IME4/ParB-like chromosome segregation protein Spo0J